MTSKIIKLENHSLRRTTICYILRVSKLIELFFDSCMVLLFSLKTRHIERKLVYIF